MNAKRAGWLLVVLVYTVLAGCAAQQGAPRQAAFQAQPLTMHGWQQKTHNLVLVLDASSSMTERFNGVEKFVIGRDFLANFNETVPDLPLLAALRSFGHSPAFSDESTVMNFGLSEYSRPGIAGALAAIVPAGGPSPMSAALEAVADDLRDTEGEIAMVLVSDGKDIEHSPLEAARALQARYADRLCIYTVLVGYDGEGRALLSSISQVAGCGQAVNAMDITSGAKMADFVAEVLLKKTETGLPEMSKAGTWVFKDIKFELDKAVLMKSSYPRLNDIVKILKTQSELKVEIQGHTDSTASDAYNLDLSRRRAQTVMKYLQSKGIAPGRMTARGYGESRPIDSNDTEKGRSNNRRVELKPLK